MVRKLNLNENFRLHGICAPTVTCTCVLRKLHVRTCTCVLRTNYLTYSSTCNCTIVKVFCNARNVYYVVPISIVMLWRNAVICFVKCRLTDYLLGVFLIVIVFNLCMVFTVNLLCSAVRNLDKHALWLQQ